MSVLNDSPARIALLLLFSVAPMAQPALVSGAPQVEGAATEDTVEDLIRSGRELLDDGQAQAAQQLFERAALLDAEAGHDPLRTRLWVLRSWMDQGRSNDTLDAIDDLRDAGTRGVEMDYLYGMAFVRRAEQLIADGVQDTAISMNIRSGYELLHKALPQAERRFRDGWISLARAGWHRAGDLANGEDLEGARAARAVARDAADRAVAFYPHHADAHLMRGHVAITQFVSELPQGAVSPADWGSAGAHWEVAARSFRAALELVDPTPDDPTRQMLAATAAMQLGNTLVWKGEREQAALAYARGIAWAPWGMNFQTLYNTLFDDRAEQPLGFVLLALEKGQAQFEEHFGPDNEADATTLWWLGWSLLEAGGREREAAEAFERSVAKWPAYSDAWYYASQARYRLADWEGAYRLLARGWSADAPRMIQLMQEGDRDGNLARAEFLKARAFAAQDLEAAVALAELVAETDQRSPTLWCDLGLFLRERGNRLRDSEQDEAVDEKVLTDLNERAWKAYSRALLLAPDNPQVLNDAAVILHYYLKRDLDVARSMYKAAERLATEALGDEDLDPALRETFATALENARANLTELDAEHGPH